MQVLKFPYLIVGGGMTADAAVRGIRQVDSAPPVAIIGQEPDPPYNRPPLSKGMWKKGPRQIPIARIWRGTDQLGAELFLGRTVTHLDPARKTVLDDHGQEYAFEKLLLATGGNPVRPWPAHARVIYYRTLADYQRLRALAESGQKFIVIGGGFIGSEMAAALLSQGKEVMIIFPEMGIGARVLPEAISRYLNGLFREKGAQVLEGQSIQAVEADNEGVTVRTDQGEILRADGVVAGLGIRPNIALAQQAGLVTGDGILVDATLHTSHPDIFAAGDVANFYNPALGRRMRAEHEENANLTGQLAGLAMAGQPAPYESLPSVYSTLFDINYDAVGDLDPRLEVIYDWKEPFKKGVAYYTRAGQVRGVLLWNVFRGLDTARALITSGDVFTAQDLKGKFPA